MVTLSRCVLWEETGAQESLASSMLDLSHLLDAHGKRCTSPLSNGSQAEVNDAR